MSARGCCPLEVSSLLGFRDYDFVVRCLELIRGQISNFAPECMVWETKVIALSHHNSSNIYPALGVFDCEAADITEIEYFGQRADEWIRKQPLGWLLDASANIPAVSWKELCEGAS